MIIWKRVEISSRNAVLAFQEGSGVFSVAMPGFHLKECTPVLKLNGKKVSLGDWKIESGTSKSLTARSEGKYGVLELKITSSDGVFTLKLKAKLQTQSPAIELYYFENGKINAEHVLTLRGGIPLGKDTNCGFSSGFHIVISRKGAQMQLSFPVLCEHVPEFSGHAHDGRLSRLAAGSKISHCSIRNIVLEPLTLRAGDGFQMIEEYANKNAVEKDFDSMVEYGWNSWDYYRWTITEDEVLANAEFIAGDPVLSKHVKRIIIDDGWQYCYGEWEANSLFPHGMKYLADKLHEMHFRPGLWIAPLVCEPHSRIAQTEPGLMAGAENGEPALAFSCMERYGFMLDPTVPAARSHISNVIDKYATMGYEYFKLDFLSPVLNARVFHDASIGHGRFIEAVINAARDGAKGRAMILGCGYQYCAGGAADYVRVGGDIHARWESLRSNTPSIAGKFWANKKLWINDPDFALCRSFDTSDDPDINRLQPCWVYNKPENASHDHFSTTYRQVDINRPQTEILLSLVIVAGGAINLSDKMYLLNEAGLDLARRTVSAEPGETGVPMDLFETDLPKYWVQKVGKSYRILMINWNDTPAELEFELPRLGIDNAHAVDFWYDTPISVKGGRLTASLAPRSCQFAVVSPLS